MATPTSTKQQREVAPVLTLHINKEKPLSRDVVDMARALTELSEPEFQEVWVWVNFCLRKKNN